MEREKLLPRTNPGDFIHEIILLHFWHMFSSTMIYCNIIGIFAWPIFSLFPVYLFIAFFFPLGWGGRDGSASATVRDSCHGYRSSRDKGGGPSRAPPIPICSQIFALSFLRTSGIYREMVFPPSHLYFFFSLSLCNFNMLSSSRIC